MEVSWNAPEALAQEHFGGVALGDARRTRRLVKIAARYLEHPEGTAPQRCRDHAELTALYRLMDSAQVTHQSVIEHHCRRTRERMRQEPVVLLLHDNTHLDYTHLAQVADLGQIGNGGGRGYICHNSLALTPRRETLGLAQQILHTRRQRRRNEKPAATRAHPQRESRLWVQAVEAIGPAPAGCQWIDVADREADTFEFMAYELRHGRSFVIRAGRNRDLEGEDHLGSDRIYLKLQEYARSLPAMGQRQVEVGAVAGKHGPRQAQALLASAPIRIAPPHFPTGETYGLEALEGWVIRVWEAGQPPAGHEPLEWILLTNLPSETWEALCQRVDWYECRPAIEDYHKGLKTGCGVERLQFASKARLEPMIGLISVTAALLLQLRHLAQQEDSGQQPIAAVLPPIYGKMLSAYYRKDRAEMTVHAFCMDLARLGGHQGRKRDGFPGWLTLWRGWTKLCLMIKGVQTLGP